MPPRKRLSRPLKIIRKSDKAIEKLIILSNVLKQALKAGPIYEVKYISPENISPSIVSTELFISYAKNYFVIYHVNYSYPEGEYIERYTLSSTCPQLRASP